MIRDYEEGSGIKGILESLVGERVAGVLTSSDNAVSIFFGSGGAVVFSAWDHGAVAIRLLSADNAPAYVKTLIRNADARRASLDRTLNALSDCKSANK